MSTTDVLQRPEGIQPDEVLTGAPPADDAPGAGKPDDCPYCGAHYQAGPEGSDWAKHYHCWQCGFDPGRPSVLAGGMPTPAFGVPAAFAKQLAAEVHAALGLSPDQNLGDVIRAIRDAQPSVTDGGEG